MKTAYFLFIGLIISCKSTKTANSEVYNESAVLNFVNSAKFIYSTSKTVIPDIVIDSLKLFNGGKYFLGDSSDINDINLTDAGISGPYRKDKLLHFALLNDSICLLVYTQGGRGSHNVVDFVKYGKEFSCLRFRTSEKLTDIKKLKSFLQSDPKPSTF